MRVSVATTITAVAAVVLAVLPRTFLTPVLDVFREPGVAVAPASSSSLIAAYPESLFSVPRTSRVTSPVFALGIGPYRHDLRLSRGERDGIKSGATVVLPTADVNPVLVGRVSGTSANGATVETISNPEWKSAVRIGTSSIDALLVGGLTPTLTLIPKGAPLAVGDAVISADSAFPYGLVIGTVAEVRDAADGVLREAMLATPYTLSGLRAVDILAN